MLKQSFQWPPVALGMKPKPLTGAYKAWHYKSPAGLPNLIISCGCPLAHPDSATLGSSSFLFLPQGPCSCSFFLLDLWHQLCTQTALSLPRALVSYAGPQKAFFTREAIQQMFMENLQLARCSSELQSSCPPAVYIRVGGNIINKQTNREILYMLHQMQWVLQRRKGAVKGLSGKNEREKEESISLLKYIFHYSLSLCFLHNAYLTG